MFRQPWYVVVQPEGKKRRVAVKYETMLLAEAEEWQRQHGGMVGSTTRLVDDFDAAAFRPASQESSPQPRAQPVPKMSPTPAANLAQPFPVIEVRNHYTDDQSVADVSIIEDLATGRTVEVVDDRSEPRSTILRFSPQLFADIMDALASVPEEEDEGGELVPR